MNIKIKSSFSIVDDSKRIQEIEYEIQRLQSEKKSLEKASDSSKQSAFDAMNTRKRKHEVKVLADFDQIRSMLEDAKIKQSVEEPEFEEIISNIDKKKVLLSDNDSSPRSYSTKKKVQISKKKRNFYSNEIKKFLVDLVEEYGLAKVSEETKVPYDTLNSMKKS